MDWTYFLAFAMFWRMSLSIRCYHCNAERNMEHEASRCEFFDYSERFIIDCPHSTMCAKKETTLRDFDGKNIDETHSVSRGCARQSREDEPTKVNGRWEYLNQIQKTYPEACVDNSPAGRVTKAVNCYCTGDLCNGGVIVKSGIGVIITAVLLIVLR